MGLFSSSKSKSTTNLTTVTQGADNGAVAIYGSDNTLVDPGAFDLARVAIEESGENFDTVVGFAEQIEENRTRETADYREQLAESASEAIQRTGAAIQTAFQTANGAVDYQKLAIGAGVLGVVALWIWRANG